MSMQTGNAIEPPDEPDSEIRAVLVRLLAGEGPVQRIETHVSTILLGGDRMLKRKRAVRLPHLDFSTPERRLAACTAELAVNRSTAPSLYRIALPAVDDERAPTVNVVGDHATP